MYFRAIGIGFANAIFRIDLMLIIFDSGRAAKQSHVTMIILPNGTPTQNTSDAFCFRSAKVLTY